MRSRRGRWALALSWAVFLLWLGSRRPDDLPAQDWWLARFDKLVHGGMYGLSGFLAAYAARWAPIRRALIAGALWGALWGGLDETWQSYTPGRFADSWDWLADVVGAGLGAGLWAWLDRTRSRAERSNR